MDSFIYRYLIFGTEYINIISGGLAVRYCEIYRDNVNYDQDSLIIYYLYIYTFYTNNINVGKMDE
jgi:hypothetical protein